MITFRNRAFSLRLTFCVVQEVSRTPLHRKNHLTQIAHFGSLSANVRIVQWIVFPGMVPTSASVSLLITILVLMQFLSLLANAPHQPPQAAITLKPICEKHYAGSKDSPAEARSAAVGLHAVISPPPLHLNTLSYLIITLISANKPNPVIITPEIRLTHCKPLGANFPRNSPTPPLKSSHHNADPMNTPKTKIPAAP